MTSPFLKAYHLLPPFARDAVAFLRGCQLRSWRYGPETEQLALEARGREKWTSDQWHASQQNRLAQLLGAASTTVPYYRRVWRDRGGDPATLKDWPVLRKSDLRRCPHDFLSSQARPGRMWVEHTSGTTGTPLQLWQPRETLRAWYALMESRWRGWYGLSYKDSWAILGGQLIVPIQKKKPPFWVWNAAFHQLYLSSYHLSARTCASYLDAIRQRQVVYLWGYASSLYSLALFASEYKLSAPPLRVVISNAEPLLQHQRETISRFFGCPVRDTYGMSEMVCGASECEADRMHLWPEAGVWEVLRDDSDEPVIPGEAGRLVATGLLNQAMPLIRYEVGDRVALSPPGENCPCGRTLPVLLSIEGRNDDLILTTDGRRIGRLDSIFKSNIPLEEAQIIQESLSLLRVLVVPGPGFSVIHEKALVAALRERVGNMEIQLERVRQIPRSANGKFLGVVSRL